MHNLKGGISASVEWTDIMPMRKFYSPRMLKLLVRVWGPYFGAGIRIKELSKDYRKVVTGMKLRWYNKNWVGTHYGGSLFSMTDPFYMLMLLNNLGPDYLVWDRMASIEYLKPGKGEVVARFELTEERIREIVEQASSGKPHYAKFVVDVVDSDGTVVAKVDKTVYVRKKPPKKDSN